MTRPIRDLVDRAMRLQVEVGHVDLRAGAGVACDMAKGPWRPCDMAKAWPTTCRRWVYGPGPAALCGRKLAAAGLAWPCDMAKARPNGVVRHS